MSLSFQKRQALMAKLQTRAKNLVPLYHRFILGGRQSLVVRCP